MKPSERMKAAADELRRLADGATQGEWRRSEQFVYAAIPGGSIGIAQYSPTDRFGQMGAGNAALMAALSPSFARAVADWLEMEGEFAAEYEAHLEGIGMAWDDGIDQPHHWTVSSAKPLALAAVVGVVAVQAEEEQK